MDLKGKVALITGGGTGLGLEIARQFAREGTNLAINYSKSKKEALEAVEELTAMGVKAAAFQADAGRESQLKNLVKEVAEKFGRIDILVNNAGTTKFVPFKDLSGLDEEVWDDILNVNTKGPFFAARAVAPVMLKNGGGVILNTASVAGIRPRGSSLAYSVSKAANIHLTRCLAIALAPEIRVNAVAPGLLLTRWGQLYSEEAIARMANEAPLKKVVSIEECAAAYILLAKNESMTGEIITVDSGAIL